MIQEFVWNISILFLTVCLYSKCYIFNREKSDIFCMVALCLLFLSYCTDSLLDFIMKNIKYLLEYDKYGPNDEINYFYSQVQNYPVTIKEPDEEVITSWEHPAYLYIQGYVNSLEQLLEADKDSLVCWSEIEGLIDVTSYIDWWLINELVCNGEVIHPKSSYMYKKRDGKLYAGPVWDFDYGTFRRGSKSLILLSSLYYKYFFEYPEFRLAVKERWAGVKDVLADVDGYILEQAGLIKASNELNISIWPIAQTINYDEKMTFDEAVESMHQVFLDRMKLVDDYILGLE